MSRIDGRKKNELRPVEITRNYTKYAEGSVLITVGDTMVVCTASVEERVPRFIYEQNIENMGWVTAEYSMLPRAASERSQRERGRTNGRNQEIQRLIGRTLRAVVDLSLLGERTIWLDCDVIQADGGTRTASITGAFVALSDACTKLRNWGLIEKTPILDFVAATSVGIVNGELMLDLCYGEDSEADVDMNIAMTSKGKFIEIQGTAEEKPFSKEEMNSMLDLATNGIKYLIDLQRGSLMKIG